MRKVGYICFLIANLLLSSCDEWLNVSPEDYISEENLFADEDGYKSLLDGTYVLMAASSAYGFELMLGFPEEVMLLWQEDSKFFEHEYEDEECQNRLLATWSQMYKAIANNNILIEHLSEKTPSTLQNYNTLLGEALGIRAFLHLDLLRLFGPVSLSDGSADAIPYRKTFDNIIQKIAPVDSVLLNIENDLLDAEQLLREETLDVDGNVVGTVSMSRMNYFAVCATLAKFYMLKGDKVNAREWAEWVIEKSPFELAQREDYVVSDVQRDLMITRELVFGLYNSQMQTRVCDQLEGGRIIINPEYKENLYLNQGNGSTNDIRYTYWFRDVPSVVAFEILNKYRRIYDDKGSDVSPKNPYMPLIRLTEMYYIAAEAWLGEDNTRAIELLNAVRKSRNLENLPSYLTTDNQILKEIIIEQRKDLWGEGKIFFTYKRLYMDIDAYEGTIPASDEIYQFPIPDDEYEFGNN